MRRSPLLRLKFQRKYPYLVSYHNIPWNCVEAGSPAAHALLAPHYGQLLSLACRSRVPGLVAAAHPEVPDERQPLLLPGMLYLTTTPAAAAPLASGAPLADAPGGTAAAEGTESEAAATAAAAGLAPFPGWTGTDVADTQALASYGPVHTRVAAVVRVVEFKSPDLRLLCHAVIFAAPHVAVSPASALAELCGGEGGERERGGGGGGGGFVLYHFFRPNRAPSELVRPLEKFYVHKPVTDVLDRLATGVPWRPVQARRTPAKAVAPIPFDVPVSYQYGLPERDAIIPGDCFGHRGNMWGYRW